MGSRNIISASLFLLAFFCAPVGAQDQEEWSIDACITYALENNIELKREGLNTEIAKHDLNQSRLNALPDLNGQVNHDLGAGRILDRGTYEWLNTQVSQGDLGLASNLTLFSGLQGYNAMKKAAADYRASVSNLEVAEDNLVLNIMNAYLDVLLNQELYEIAHEKVRVAELQVERMEQLVEVGNAASGELLQVKSTASTEKYQMTLAKNRLNFSKLELAQRMNLPVDASFEINKPEIQDPSELQVPNLDDVYHKAAEILPHIDVAEFNITSSEKSLAVARGALSPELFVRALYYSTYSDKLINPREIDPANPVLEYPVPQQVFDNQYRQLTVGVNIPIFNKWQNRTNISKAKIGLMDAQLRLENTRQQLYKDIQKYHSELLGALDNYRSASESHANNQEAYRYAEERFRVGMATALELEEARNKLFEAQAEMVASKYRFVFYEKILDFYRGEDVNFN